MDILFCLALLMIQLSKLHAIRSIDCTYIEKCKCTKININYFKADCSKKKLMEIPMFKDNVIDIDLSRNENLTVIREGNFPHNLEKLDISSCNFQTIELGAFEKSKNLSFLDMSWNPLLTLNVLQNITNDLIGSKIHTLKFNGIQCSVGGGTTLKHEHLCRLQNTSLTVMEMSKNRIDMVEQFTFLSLPSSLMNLSIGHNRLRFGMYFLEFSSLVNLRHLNLSDMYSFDNPFTHPWSITCNEEDRNWNPYRAYAGLTPCPKLMKAGRPNLPDIKVFMHMAPKLETIVINNCLIMLTSKWNNLVLKFDSLKRIFANHMFVKSLNGFDYSQKLEEAYLSNSFIRDADDLFFSTSNLTILDLSYNLLNHYFSTLRSAKHFQSQKYLKILNLSGNRLQHAPSDLFKALTRLKILNISETELTRIHFMLDGLTSLRTLDLSNNKIRKFTDSNMQVFDHLSERTVLSINLTGNDISCTCETLKFLNWMQRKQTEHSRIKLTNFNDYTCFLSDSKLIDFNNITETIIALEKECSSKYAVFIVTGFLLLGFIVIVISGILYRYRWNLRYMYHMTRRSLRGYFLLQNEDGVEKKCFEFDAFISYAEEDFDFSHDKLKSKLRINYPSAKLCYHKEHFIPGRSIPESIVNAVNCSRKTVCVLSEHFLASEWCIYEFKMANLEKIYKRGDQDSLLILMLGSINLERVPADMMTYLKSRSYIEVPKNIEDSDDFWKHITSAIMED